MDKNDDGRISVEEFISVFQEANKLLREKISNAQGYINDYRRQQREVEEQYQEQCRKEEINEFGIMKGSYLNVIIVSAELAGAAQVYA